MLNYNRFLPAFLLAIVMQIGCKEPVGLPNNDVRVASTCTTFCVVSSTENLSGRVEWRQTLLNPGGTYSRTNGDIWRAYYEQDGLPYPKTYGFCVFDVPEFESPNTIPVCTLYYYQSAHNGSLNLVFNWLSGIGLWPGFDDVLFKAIDTSSFTLAEDSTWASNGWCKVELTAEGSGTLEDFASGGGGEFYTGWKYDNTPTDGWYTYVTGVDDAVSPYIKVVYYPDP